MSSIIKVLLFTLAFISLNVLSSVPKKYLDVTESHYFGSQYFKSPYQMEEVIILKCNPKGYCYKYKIILQKDSKKLCVLTITQGLTHKLDRVDNKALQRINRKTDCHLETIEFDKKYLTIKYQLLPERREFNKINTLSRYKNCKKHKEREHYKRLVNHNSFSIKDCYTIKIE